MAAKVSGILASGEYLSKVSYQCSISTIHPFMSSMGWRITIVLSNCRDTGQDNIKIHSTTGSPRFSLTRFATASLHFRVSTQKQPRIRLQLERVKAFKPKSFKQFCEAIQIRFREISVLNGNNHFHKLQKLSGTGGPKTSFVGSYHQQQFVPQHKVKSKYMNPI